MCVSALTAFGTFVGEVQEIDLAAASGLELEELRELFLQFKVLIFKSQSLSPSAHLDFARYFGSIDVHVLDNFQHPNHPGIMLLSNRTDADGKLVGVPDAGREWHSDCSFSKIPPLGTILSAVELPPSGSFTDFADMESAFENLPASLLNLVDGHQAVFSYVDSYNRKRQINPARPALTEEQLSKLPDVIHPVIRTHPETGRKSVFVNPAHTRSLVGYDASISANILDKIFEHATQSKFRYRHRWADGDVVMWDNRCTIHKANAYPAGETRHLHRTTIKGTVPV